MSDQIESEFRLRARRRLEVAAVDAALLDLDAPCRLRTSRRHSDTYLDDSLGSLMRAGIGLRLRLHSSSRVLTCKLRRAMEGVLHVRRELEAPWRPDSLPELAGQLPEPLRGALQPLLDDRVLLPRQRLEVQRELRALTKSGSDLCELAIDSVEAIANDRTAEFQEIELEVIADVAANERLAHELRERLPVEFAGDDKPSHAAALLGIELPPRP